jgi:hypothetical protein
MRAKGELIGLLGLFKQTETSTPANENSFVSAAADELGMLVESSFLWK